MRSPIRCMVLSIPPITCHKMNRLFSMLASALLLQCSLWAQSASEQKPNFIFVLSDDVAQGDLGCYGQTLIQTPRLDQMAAEGDSISSSVLRYKRLCSKSIVFLSPVCTPGIARCGETTKWHLREQLPLPEETVTIAEVAKSAGYQTATFGKWGMGFFTTSGSPMKQGGRPFLWLQLSAPCPFLLSHLPV